MEMDDDTHEALQAPPYACIGTKRLRLRTLRVADASALFPILTLPEVMKWTTTGFPLKDMAQAEQWVRDRALGSDVFNFAIELLPEDASAHPAGTRKVIGLVGSFHPPQIGYIIHPDHSGRGYATEALHALISPLFDRMPPAADGGVGCDYLEGCTDAENYGSRRVLEKCGFRHCETREKDFQNPALGTRDTAFYRLARPGKTLEEMHLMPSQRTVDQAAGDRIQPPIE